MNNQFFSIEDICLYKGKDMINFDFKYKINQISYILKNEIKQISYNNTFVVFGLPVISNNVHDFERKISTITYKLYSIKYVKNNCHFTLTFDKFKSQFKENIVASVKENIVASVKENSVTSVKENIVEKKFISKQDKIFMCKPDIQNDIYHLYTSDNEYVGLAAIPDYKTSIMMNKLFRIIKENNDLDALEESDDEEEFENSNVDKFVHLNNSYKMVCVFNNKFRKWVPKTKA
jgi:hypothetical protein